MPNDAIPVIIQPIAPALFSLGRCSPTKEFVIGCTIAVPIPAMGNTKSRNVKLGVIEHPSAEIAMIMIPANRSARARVLLNS